MKISKQTISILKSFTTINKSLYFNEEGFIKSKSDCNSIVAVAKIPEVFPEFGIFALDKFVQILSSFKDDEIEFEFIGSVLKISQGKSSLKYRLPSKDYIQNVCPPSEKYLSFNNFDASFSLTADELNGITKAARIIGFNDKDDYVNIKLDGGKGIIKLFNKHNSLSDEYELGIDGKGDCDVNMSLNSFIFMNGNYDVFVLNGKMVSFKTTDLEYFIGVDEE